VQPELPIRHGPVRFAIGSPHGLASNSWRVWVKREQVYIACRDNFKEAKVSLHSEGKWRMGFTEEAIRRKPSLLPEGQNRAWDLWDEPPPSLPNTIIAFRLPFLTSELAVPPQRRAPADWKNVIYVEAAPPGKMTTVTLFITRGDPELKHETEPSVRIASLEIGDGRRAQLVAHGEPEGDLPALVARSVAEIRKGVLSRGLTIPPEAFAYMLGKHTDGVRYLVGTRVDAASSGGRPTTWGVS